MEVGDILDTYYRIGQALYGYIVIDPCSKDQSLLGSYSYHTEECPNCSSTNTWTVVLDYCPIMATAYSIKILPGKKSYNWYCKDCWIVWKSIYIGSVPQLEEENNED